MSRTDQAFDIIRGKLIDLTYPPGSTFTEGELVSSLGLTKTPVREALLMLSTTGLVMARPGAGYVVMPITLKDIRSLCRHWRRLEGEAAAMTAGQGLGGQLVMHLTDLVNGFGYASDVSLIERAAELHAWIVETSDDAYLTRDFMTLLAEIMRLYQLTVGAEPKGLADGLSALLRAVMSGDPSQARDAVHTFVDRFEMQAIDVLLSSEVLMTTNLGLPGPSR